jgi:hypothetical protein
MGPLTPTLSRKRGEGVNWHAFGIPRPACGARVASVASRVRGSYASLPGSAIAADHGDITSVMP